MTHDLDAQAADYVHAARIREVAIALQWSRAQGEIMHQAHTAGLYLDDKGFHLAGRRGGRGRQVRRTRVEALITAGFITVEAGAVVFTNDGYDAYMSWSLNVDASVDVDAERDVLPPLPRGEEAGRRRAAWDAHAAAVEARAADQRAYIAAAAERAEAERAALPARSAAAGASAAWDEVYGPEVVHGYTDADRGNVITLAGVDVADVVDPAAAVELAALAVVIAAELAERPAAAPASFVASPLHGSVKCCSVSIAQPDRPTRGNTVKLPNTAAPLYMTPPCASPRVEAAMRAGELGMISTPRQGNRMVAGAWWCYDNGVFGGHYPGHERFLDGLAKLAHLADSCLFVVLPDVVGNHWATKEAATAPFTLPGEDDDDARNMIERIREMGFPVAFVAQPGIEYDAWDLWDDVDAIFIGGGSDWKTSEGVAELVAVAKSLGKWVHMGRVNTAERYAAAAAMGCDSVDGTLLTFGPNKNLRRVLKWRGDALAEAGAMLGRAVDFPHVNGWNPDAVRPNRFAKRTPAAPAAEVVELALFDLDAPAAPAAELVEVEQLDLFDLAA